MNAVLILICYSVSSTCLKVHRYSPFTTCYVCSSRCIPSWFVIKSVKLFLNHCIMQWMWFAGMLKQLLSLHSIPGVWGQLKVVF